MVDARWIVPLAIEVAGGATLAIIGFGLIPLAGTMFLEVGVIASALVALGIALSAALLGGITHPVIPVLLFALVFFGAIILEVFHWWGY